MEKESDVLSRLWRAIIEFDMLKKGDKVLIGLSGGKDSMFLAHCLVELQKHVPFKFELACLTIDTRFVADFPRELYEKFCSRLNLKWYSESVDVPSLMRPNTSACYSCAYFRRAVMNRRAAELGFNKVALAHHHDDAVHTFLLNLLTSGQLKTFRPVTELSRSGITVIRPLIYYRETEIINRIEEMGFMPIKNQCPYDGNTTRKDVKDLLTKLKKDYSEVYDHLAAAMRMQKGMELWPEKLEKDKIVEKFRGFWKDKE